jgi:hypothetical protein
MANLLPDTIFFIYLQLKLWLNLNMLCAGAFFILLRHKILPNLVSKTCILKKPSNHQNDTGGMLDKDTQTKD